MRQVLRRFAVLGSSSLVTQLIAFGALAYAARRVGPTNLGAYSVVLSLVTFLSLPISLGITTVGTRDLARAPERARTVAGEVFALQLAFALCGYGLIVLFAPVIAPTGAMRRLFPIVGLFLLTGTSFEWALQALGRIRAVAAARIAGQLLFGALVPVLVVGGLSGMERYAWLMIGGLGLKHLLTTAALIRASGPPRLLHPRARLRQRLHESLPMGYASVMLQVYGTIDQIMLGYLSTSFDAGEYAAANRIPSALLTFSGSWLAVVFPHSAAVAATDPRRLRRDAGRMLVAVAGFALPLAACTPFVAGGLMAAAFGSRFAAAGTAFALLVVTIALALLDGTLTTIVMGLGGDRRYARAITLTAVLNVLANVIAIPLFGRNGAAVVTIASEALLFSILARSAWILLGGIEIEWWRLQRIVLATFPAVMALLVLPDSVSVWLRILIGAVSYLAAATFAGVVTRAEARAVLAPPPRVG
ncbi:MAG: oligosaccharide flippase family protein [Solirubrobacteraceae bacterium]